MGTPMVNEVAALQAAGSIPSGCNEYHFEKASLQDAVGIISRRMIMILKGSNYNSPGPCPGFSDVGLFRP